MMKIEKILDSRWLSSAILIVLQNSIKPGQPGGHRGVPTVHVLSCSPPWFLSTFIRTSSGSLGLGCPGHGGGKWVILGPVTSSCLFLPYSPLWEYLGDTFFQWEDIKLKRPLGLLSRKILILLAGFTDLCSQSNTFLRMNLQLQLH